MNKRRRQTRAVNKRRRRIGGENNRKGNRFEDGFAVYRLIQLSARIIDNKVTVRIKEQAGCWVDDLLIQEDTQWHYYQLKDDREITWNRRNGQLRREFAMQKRECEKRRESFTLTVVVSHEHRKKVLDVQTPASLADHVTVIHFAPIRRPSELAQRTELKDHLRQLSGSRAPTTGNLLSVVQAFYFAWIDAALDADGFTDLRQMLEGLQHSDFNVRRPLPTPIHLRWEEFQRIMAGIPELEYHVDRGYFEWFSGTSESGQHPKPCGDDSFRRFVDRVLENRPTNFEEFEVLL